MDPKIKRWLTFLIASAALAAFVAVYVVLLTREWPLEAGRPVVPGNLQTAAGLLSGLVGGIVAAAFGQTLPASGLSGSWLTRRLSAGGYFLFPWDEARLRSLLTAAYSLAYLAVSAWAVVVWLMDNPATPELVNHLATVSLGLFAAIARSFLSDPAGPEAAAVRAGHQPTMHSPTV